MRKPLVLLRGGGDVASGIAYRVARRGLGVVVAELPKPTMVRRAVSFGNAVYEGEVEIEGLRGVLCPCAKEAYIAVHRGDVAVVVDPVCSWLTHFRPDVLVDARMAKRNLGTKMTDAPLVIGVGPGFTAGLDCHAVVESLRGPRLGAVVYEGGAAANTGEPAPVDGKSQERVLRAPAAGTFRADVRIGDRVREGQAVARVESAGGRRSRSVAVRAGVSGVVRGLLADGLRVRKGQKVGDVDPRGERERCFTISDKSLAVGDGVLRAIEKLAPRVLEGAWPPPVAPLRGAA